MNLRPVNMPFLTAQSCTLRCTVGAVLRLATGGPGFALVLLLFTGSLFPSKAQTVSLSEDGSSVTLSNAFVTATFAKNNGNCTSLRHLGGPNLLANGGRLYFDANGSVNGGSSVYVPFAAHFYRVVTNTAQRVEISFTDTNLTGFNAELHCSMGSADSGFYVYTLWRHGPDNPQAMLEQSRMVLRCDPNIFTHAFSSTNKVGQMIAPSLLKSSPVIMDATYKLPRVSSYTNATGYTQDAYPVYTKYDWCDYMENHNVEGLTGDTTGLWMLFGSAEYFNGGPTKANLLLHGTDTTPVLLWDFHAQHFGGAKIEMAAGETWNKIMGPCFIYVNTGTSTAELWQDARQQAAVQQAAWPCGWVNATNYPLARGTVSGRLHIAGESTANALLVLAQPGQYWQLQSKGYEFWTRAHDDGSFAISRIRPGSYALYARVPGVIGQYELNAVQVAADQTNDLGVLDWNPPRRERRLWRIGVPDLSAAEFRFGSEMRQFGLWWRYLEEQGTNDLVYRVGTSVATNWYYAQSVLAMEDGTYFSPKWNIEFTLNSLPPSPAVLTIDLAGGIGGTFLTSVNGNSLDNISIANDGSIYRSATRSGLFRHFELSFAPSLLRLGTNLISFTVSKPSPWTNSTSVKPVQPTRGVMYDCVQLEAGPLLATITPQLTNVSEFESGLTLAGTGGAPGAAYCLLGTTNLALPVSQWTRVATNHFDDNGNFAVQADLAPGLSQSFYRLQIP